MPFIVASPTATTILFVSNASDASPISSFSMVCFLFANLFTRMCGRCCRICTGPVQQTLCYMRIDIHICMYVYLCVCVPQLLLLFASWAAFGAGRRRLCATRRIRNRAARSPILQQIPNARHEQLLNFAKHTHIICLNSANVSVGL